MIIDIGSLSAQEQRALRDVAAGRILFHNGLWGAEPCYMWASDEPGRGAGRLLSWESDALDRLIRLRLVEVRPGRPSADVPVVLAGQVAMPPSAA